jgi:hypothetical protein
MYSHDFYLSCDSLEGSDNQIVLSHTKKERKFEEKGFEDHFISTYG